jgi:serine/threonine-protein kinase
MASKRDTAPETRGEPTLVGRRLGRRDALSTPPESEVRSVRRDSLSASTHGDGGTDAERSRSAGSATEAALVEVMLAEEATRAHGFGGMIALICAAMVVALPLLGGDPVAEAAALTALAVMGLFSAGVWAVTREDGSRYTRRLHQAYGWTLATGVVAVEAYFGFFSPVPVVLTLGIYYLGQSHDRRQAFLLPIAIIAVYAGLAVATVLGVLPDRGLFPADLVHPGVRAFAAAAVAAVLAITLRMARVSRTALREAIRNSNDALLVAQRREAQLAEAHHQLDRALRVAVGRPGRHSGSRAGDFVLHEVVGVGAIGEVYRAEHATTGAPAAVKLLQADASNRDDLIERFLREGRISGKLDSPHVVRVLEVGTMDDGAPYLAMELLHGRDLASRLRQEGQLPLDELPRLVQEVAVGLDHAHASGVVHRDLKPLNVFEARDGERLRWKILDFGISKLSNSSGTLTREGVVGTPGYMSPEQARGVEVDGRSDVFSLAVLLYRAMTGRPAFPGDNTPQIMFDIVYKSPPRPSQVTPGLPTDVDLVMAIGLAKDPDDRFASASDLAAAFRHACKRRLDRELRRRGHAIIRAYPWGRTMAPGLSPEDGAAPEAE